MSDPIPSKSLTQLTVLFTHVGGAPISILSPTAQTYGESLSLRYVTSHYITVGGAPMVETRMVEKDGGYLVIRSPIGAAHQSTLKDTIEASIIWLRTSRDSRRMSK